MEYQKSSYIPSKMRLEIIDKNIVDFGQFYFFIFLYNGEVFPIIKWPDSLL